MTTDANLDAVAVYKDGVAALNEAASAIELLNAEGRVTARTPLRDLSGELTDVDR